MNKILVTDPNLRTFLEIFSGWPQAERAACLRSAQRMVAGMPVEKSLALFKREIADARVTTEG